MRINLPRWLIGIAVLSLAACTPSQDNSYASQFVSGYVVVHEIFWSADHDTPTHLRHQVRYPAFIIQILVLKYILNL